MAGFTYAVVKAGNPTAVFTLRPVRERAGFHLAMAKPIRSVVTLCGLQVTRRLPEFAPHEASCRECLRKAGIR